MSFFTQAKQISKDTLRFLKEDEPIVYCAAIAFFTIFSLPAILIVVVLIGSLFFSEEDVRSEILNQVSQNVNEEASRQVKEVLENALDLPGQIWWIIIGILVIIKSATMIFFIIQKALNAIWKVEVKKNVNYFRLMKHRSITLAFVGGLGLLLIISIMADTFINFFGDEIGFLWEGFPKPITRIGGLAFNLLMVFVFFAAIHKTLPDVIISWKDALVGGTITAILFMIGKEIISLILNNIKIEGYYATAGSLVILLLWVFYSSIILYLGAEITRAYSNSHGRKTKPSSIAFKYSEKNQRKV
jgi:membrane protein